MNELKCNRVYNLTGHTINIQTESGDVLISKPFEISNLKKIRCDYKKENIGYVTVNTRKENTTELHEVKIPLRRTTCVPNYTIPKNDSICWLVSKIAANAFRKKKNVFFPDDLIKDEYGTVIGCRTFSTADSDKVWDYEDAKWKED